jgi:hypothetical protein
MGCGDSKGSNDISPELAQVIVQDLISMMHDATILVAS